MLLLAGLAFADSNSDTVCIAVPGATTDAVAATITESMPASIREGRAALLRDEPVLPIPYDDWAAWLPVAPSTRSTLELRTAITIDPANRRRGWLAVEVAAPQAQRLTPLDLVVLVDLSASMLTVPAVGFPMLQDETVEPGCCDPIARLDLARIALHDLVDLAPTDTTITLLPFVRDRGEIRADRVDVAENRVALHNAIDGLVPWSFAPQGTTFELVDRIAASYRDPCADRRILLVTDDRARLHLDAIRITAEIESWVGLGLETWALSVGLLDGDARQLTQRTEQGGGALLRADTRSEAVEALRGALRTGGTVARDAAVRVVPGPGILAWRHAGGASMVVDADLWTMPDLVPGGFGQAMLYELTLDPARGQPSVTVEASAGSPNPGDWKWSDRQRPQVTPLSKAPGFLRSHVLASVLSAQLAGAAPRADLMSALAREDGPEKELAAWSALLAERR